MYLVVSGAKTNNYFCQQLSISQIELQSIKCIDFIPNNAVINQLKQEINDFDIVIITSPITIEYAHDVLSGINKKTVFVVSGVGSYNKLKQYTTNKIYAPDTGSGAAAIISQILEPMDLKRKKIALLVSPNANKQIPNYLTQKYGLSSYTPRIIYEQKWLDISILKKLLINNCLQGIILTSSSHAKYLFDMAESFGYANMLRKIDFITLHTKIEQVLREHGVKAQIFVSDTASNESLINLIRKLHDRHNRICES